MTERLPEFEVLNHVDQGVTLFDRNLNLVASNPIFLSLMQLPPSLARSGTSIETMYWYIAEKGEYGEGDVEKLVRERIDLARKFEPHDFEQERSDGRVIRIVGRPISAGRDGFVTVYTDVTDERRTTLEREQRIQQLAEELNNRTGFEALSEIDTGILLLDSNLDVLFANQAWTRLSVVANQDLLKPGAPFKSIIRVAAQEGMYGPGEIETIVDERIKLLGRRESYDLVRETKPGLFVEIRVRPLPDGGFLFLNVDVTESQRKAREQNQRIDQLEKGGLTELLDQLGIGVAIYDEEARLLRTNQTRNEFYQYPEELTRPGTPNEAHIRHNAEHGLYGEVGDIEAFVTQRMELGKRLSKKGRGSIGVVDQTLPDGRIIEIRMQRIGNGDQIDVLTDVTSARRREKEKEQKFAEERLLEIRQLHDASLDGVVTIDSESIIQSANPAAETIFGYNSSELVGQSVDILMGSDDLAEKHHQGVERYLRTGEKRALGQVVEVTGMRKDGEAIPIELLVVESSSSDYGKFTASIRDLTDLRDKEDKIEELENRMGLDTLDYLDVGISIIDSDLKIVHLNPAANALYGLEDWSWKVGDSFKIILKRLAEMGVYDRLYGKENPEEQVSRIVTSLKGDWKEWRGDLELADGRVIDVRTHKLAGGGLAYLHTDVTAERQKEKRLTSTDRLTGLPNLEHLEQLGRTAMREAEQSGKEIYVIRIRIDRFQSVNQLYGTEVGNGLIKDVAARLRESVPDEVVLGRGQGNEYFVAELCANSREESETTTTLLQEAMRFPFQISDYGRGEAEDLTFTLSAGIALYPKDGKGLGSLLKKSQLALQYASEKSDTFHYFDWRAARRKGSGERFRLENDLRVALQESQFELHYQPQIDLQSGQLTGTEALLRWSRPGSGNKPESQPISPAEFIPVAEESGLIIPIGKWVLEEASRQAKHWQDEGYAPVTMSVNVSVVQFRQPDLIEQVREVLSRTGLSPEWLELEITESIVVEDIDWIIKTLGELKALGIKIAIDDFGTGYSSLSYLARLPFDKLKIDQSFVRNTDRQNWAIVRAVVQLARSLELMIVAEGVETKDSMQHLRDLGCHIGQGFYFSRPVLAQDFTEFFKQQDNPYVYVPPSAEQALHVGLPTDYGLAYLNDQLAEFREKNTDVPIVVRCDLSDLLVESLVLGELDTAIAIVREGSENWLSETWEIDPVWAVASDFVLRDEEAVPLVVHPEGCEYRSRVVESLNAVGRNWYVVYQSPDISGLQEAVVQGLGISALTQPTLVSGMRVLESGIDLPHMRAINVGLYLTQNGRSEKAMLLDSWLREALGRREFPETQGTNGRLSIGVDR